MHHSQAPRTRPQDACTRRTPRCEHRGAFRGGELRTAGPVPGGIQASSRWLSRSNFREELSRSPRLLLTLVRARRVPVSGCDLKLLFSNVLRDSQRSPSLGHVGRFGLCDRTRWPRGPAGQRVGIKKGPRRTPGPFPTRDGNRLERYVVSVLVDEVSARATAAGREGHAGEASC